MIIEMLHATLIAANTITATRKLTETRKSLAAKTPATIWNMRAEAIRQNANLCRMRGGALVVMTDEQTEDGAESIDLVIGSAIDGKWYWSACAVAEGLDIFG